MHSDDPFPLHYEALGVPEDATTDVIRTAWREIARSSHPDHVRADVAAMQRFLLASDAWSVLRDAEDRAAYDAELAQLRMPRCIQCGQPSASRLCTLCAISSMKPPHSTPKPAPKPKPPPKPPPRPAPPPPSRPAPPPRPAPAAAPPPIPEEPVASRLRREAAEQDAVNRTHAYDDIDQLHAPSGDNLLEALLADAAVRAAGSAPKKKKKRKGSKLEVKVAPGFTVSLEGETYETIAGVNKNLRLANRLLSSISRFFRG